jgi:DNA-binding Lrp family transcriptional regulator
MYRDAIKYSENRMRFDNEAFINSSPQNYKNFVTKIVQLQVFQQFIEERLKLIQSNSEMTDEFEIEVELHAAKMGKKIHQYKEYIRNIKGRTNPAVKNAVKSVTKKYLKDKFLKLLIYYNFHFKVKATCKELKMKIKDTSSKKSEKFDYMNTISSTKNEKTSEQMSTNFHLFYPNTSNSLVESPSTSSSQSSSSDMNILQELEAQGMFKRSSIPSFDDIEKTTNECNLIDLSDSTSDIAQFDPIESNERKKYTHDPFGSSELLSDVIDELNKSAVIASDRNNWTKFD